MTIIRGHKNIEMTLRTVSHPLPQFKMITDQAEHLFFFFSKSCSEQHHLSCVWDGISTCGKCCGIRQRKGKVVPWCGLHCDKEHCEKSREGWVCNVSSEGRQRLPLRTFFEFYYIFLVLQFFRLTKNEISNKSVKCENITMNFELANTLELTNNKWNNWVID